MCCLNHCSHLVWLKVCGQEDVERERKEVNGDLSVQQKDMKGTGDHCQVQGQTWAPPLQRGMWFGKKKKQRAWCPEGGRRGGWGQT